MFLKAWPLPICSDLGKTSTSIKQLRVLFQGFPAGGVLLIEAREKSLCKLLPNLLCMVGFEIPWISLQWCFWLFLSSFGRFFTTAVSRSISNESNTCNLFLPRSISNEPSSIDWCVCIFVFTAHLCGYRVGDSGVSQFWFWHSKIFSTFFGLLYG